LKKARSEERKSLRIASLVAGGATEVVRTPEAHFSVPVSSYYGSIEVEEDDSDCEGGEKSDDAGEGPQLECMASRETSSNPPLIEMKKSNRRAKREPVINPWLVDGLDVSKLVITPPQQFGIPVITSSDISDKNLLTKILYGEIYYGFTTGFLLMLGYDERVLPNKLTRNVMMALFRFLTGYDNLEEVPDVEVARKLAPFVGSNAFGPGFEESVQKYRTRQSEWFVIKVRPSWVVLTTRELAREDKKPRVFKFNLFRDWETRSGRASHILVDTRFVDDFLPRPLRREIFEIARLKSVRDMAQFASDYPKLSVELGDVFEHFIGNRERESGALIRVTSDMPRSDKPYLVSIGYLGKSS
jgi:hypothetical protein